MARKQWHPWRWFQREILTFKEAKALRNRLQRRIRKGGLYKPHSQYRMSKRYKLIPTDDPFTFEEHFKGWGVKVRRNLKDDL